MMANRRLREMQLLGRFREAQAFGRIEEGLQFREVDRELRPLRTLDHERITLIGER